MKENVRNPAAGFDSRIYSEGDLPEPLRNVCAGATMAMLPAGIFFSLTQSLVKQKLKMGVGRSVYRKQNKREKKKRRNPFFFFLFFERRYT